LDSKSYPGLVHLVRNAAYKPVKVFNKHQRLKTLAISVGVRLGIKIENGENDLILGKNLGLDI